MYQLPSSQQIEPHNLIHTTPSLTLNPKENFVSGLKMVTSNTGETGSTSSFVIWSARAVYTKLCNII